MLEDVLKSFYEYNSRIRDKGFYLKPVHIVSRSVGGVKRTYYYVGRYWWRLEYAGKRGKTSKVRWRYVGREKPPDLPEPPPNPLEGLRFYAVGNDVYLDRKTFEKYRWVFAGHSVEDQCEENENNNG